MKEHLIFVALAVLLLAVGYWFYNRDTSGIATSVSEVVNPPSRSDTVTNTFFDLSKLEVSQTAFKMRAFLVDLNNDDLLDVLLYPEAPSDFCGSGGCPLMVLTNTGEGWEMNTSIGVTRSVYLGTTYTNGWRDIVTEYSGGGGGSGFTKQQFDGKEYSPGNASLGAPVTSVEGFEKVF